MSTNSSPAAGNEILLNQIANAPHWVFGSRLRNLSQTFSDSSSNIKRMESNLGWNGASAEAAKQQIRRIASGMEHNAAAVAAIRVHMQDANAVLDEAKNRLASLPQGGLGFWDSAGTWLGAVFTGDDGDSKIQKAEHEKSVIRENAAKAALEDIQTRLQDIAGRLGQTMQSLEPIQNRRSSPSNVPSGPGYSPGGSGGGGPQVGPSRGSGGSLPPTPMSGTIPPSDWSRDEFGTLSKGGAGLPHFSSYPSVPDQIFTAPSIPEYFHGRPSGPDTYPGYIPGDDNHYEGSPSEGYSPWSGSYDGSAYTGGANRGYESSTSADSSMSGGATAFGSGGGGSALAGGAAAGGLGLAAKLGGAGAGLGSGLAGTTAAAGGAFGAPAAAGAGAGTGSASPNSGGRGGMGMMGGAGAGGGSDKEKKSGNLGLIAPKLEDEDPRLTKKASGAKAGSRAPKTDTAQ